MLYLGFNNETKVKVPMKEMAAILAKFQDVVKTRVKKKLKDRDGQIDLVFINDRKMKSMNAEYRKKNSPTDVLAFAYLEVTKFADMPEGPIVAGDVFISLDTAKKQAKEKGHTLLREVEILFIHGLLHCFGYDHQTDAEEAEMERWAGRVLAT